MSVLQLSFFFNTLSLRCVIVTGSRVPSLDPLAGGFTGGIRTSYGSFSVPRHPKMLVNLDDASESDEDDDRPKARPRGRYSSHIDLLYSCSSFNSSVIFQVRLVHHLQPFRHSKCPVSILIRRQTLSADFLSSQRPAGHFPIDRLSQQRMEEMNPFLWSHIKILKRSPLP